HQAIPQRGCVPAEPASASPGPLSLQAVRSNRGLLEESDTTFLLLPDEKGARRWINSMSEIPVRPAPRRLADWINPTGDKKVHSLIDKVYKQKNLEIAWECVKANRGSGGVDGQSLEEFGKQLDSQLNRLHTELREDCYQPRPVRQVQIPKAGKPGEFRTLGIPTIYDRVCQQ